MNLIDILNIIAKELGTADLQEINKLLKDEPTIKFRITGKAMGHFGFTGQIKSVSEEGVKAFMANKVSLIRLADIESFEKAKPRAERSVRAAKTEAPKFTSAKSSNKKPKSDAKDIEDFKDDDDDFEGFRPKKLKAAKGKAVGKKGSKFIPVAKKK